MAKPIQGKITNFLKQNWIFFCFFFVLLATQLIWLLAFWPGLMSPDSIAHWTEANRGTFFNWHPYIYAFVLSLFVKIKSTPAWWPLIQITTFSFFIAAFLNYLKKLGAPVWILFVSFCYYLIWPIFGNLNVTLWKDIIYSILIFGISFLYFYIYTEKIKSYWIAGTIGVLTGLVATLRFNGLVYLLVVPILALWIFWKHKKVFTVILIMTLVSFSCFYFVLPKVLKVKPANVVVDQIRLQFIGAILHNGGKLNSSEEETVSKVLSPKFMADNYTCNDVGRLFYNAQIEERLHETAFQSFDNDPSFVKKWDAATISLVSRYPKQVVSDRVCITYFLLGIKDGQETSILDNYIHPVGVPYFLNTPPYDKPMLSVPQAPKLIGVNKFLINEVNLTKEHKIYDTIFWASWPLIFVYLLAALWSIIKKRWDILLYTFLINVNFAALIPLTPGSGVRYVYASFIGFGILISMLFSKRTVG